MATKPLAYPPGITADIHSTPSRDALPRFAKLTRGRALVSFSLGKDSVAAVLALREAGFTELHLFYMYSVPGLRLVEEGLAYYEDLWGTRITRLPAPTLHARLGAKVLQPLHRYPMIDLWGPVRYDYDDVAGFIRTDLGWPDSVPMAVGIRAADSIFRRSALKKSGVYNVRRNVLHPVFDWSNDDLEAAFTRTRTFLPPDYHLFGLSLDGLDYRFIEPLKRYYPDDYARLCEWYPLLPSNLARYAFAKRRAERNSFRAL